MRNTGILLFIVGIYIVINSGSFRDLAVGKARLNFVNPQTASNKANKSPGSHAGSQVA